jgi:hypothetical protein
MGVRKYVGLSHAVILGRVHRVRRWGGKDGKHYGDFRRVVEKLKTDSLLTEDQAIAQLETVKGDERHTYLLGIDGEKRGDKYGGKGGKHYDDFRHVVEKLKTDSLLTECLRNKVLHS